MKTPAHSEMDQRKLYGNGGEIADALLRSIQVPQGLFRFAALQGDRSPTDSPDEAA